MPSGVELETPWVYLSPLYVTIGNLLVAFLAPLEKAFPLSVFFFVFAGLMTVAALVFAALAYTDKGKTYLQG